MGCGCNKVAVGRVAAPQARGPAPVRSYFVDGSGVREVTGMTLPARHQAAITQVGQATSASEQDRTIVPSLLIGTAGGVVLAKTVLMAHPFLAAAVGLGFGAWYGLATMFNECTPLLGPPSTDPSVIARCQTQGAVVGGAVGVGAGLLIEGLIDQSRR